jgi:hypothetical protein
VVVNERDMTQLNAIYDQLEQFRMVTEKIKDKLAELSWKVRPKIFWTIPTSRPPISGYNPLY